MQLDLLTSSSEERHANRSVSLDSAADWMTTVATWRLSFAALLSEHAPRWIIWENVPGVLSLDGGRAFASILGGLAECGYGLAYRVLDAQFVRTQSHPRAVPQRRRRVFVVGYSGGDWRRAAAVLFERESMRRDSPPSRKAGQNAAPTISARTQGSGGLGTDFDCDGGLVTTPTAAELAMRSLRRDVRGQVCDQTGGPRQPDTARMSEMRNGGEGDVFDGGLVAKSLCAGGYSNNPLDENLIAHALRGEGFDASEDGTGRGTPLVPVAIQERAVSDNPDAGPNGVGVRTDGAAYTLEARTVPQAVAFAENSRAEIRLCGGDGNVSSQLTTGGGKPGQGQPCLAFSCKDSGNDAMTEVARTMRAMGHDGSHANAGGQLGVAFDLRGREGGSQFEGSHETANIRAGSGGSSKSYVAQPWAVRRLIPEECEKLQGFKPGYTQVPYRGKPAADGPRYKALGNSMAVNVMRWIGERIAMKEAQP
jgi:DNA (cytosine-5)-methyltransferase 1